MWLHIHADIEFFHISEEAQVHTIFSIWGMSSLTSTGMDRLNNQTPMACGVCVFVSSNSINNEIEPMKWHLWFAFFLKQNGYHITLTNLYTDTLDLF